jgi:uncharacterized protein DUF903
MSNDENIQVADSSPAIRASLLNCVRKKSRFLSILAACSLTTGCSTSYVVRLTNSDEVITRTKPRLDNRGFYVFKDADGREVRVSEWKVREIEAK